MKKLLMAMLLLSIFSISVVAQTGGSLCKGSLEYCNLNNKCVRNLDTQCLIEEQSKVTGLENAMLRVKTEEQKQHLQEVLLKIQEKRVAQISKLEELKITVTSDSKFTSKFTEIEIEGKTNAKFFGILPFKKIVKYKLLEDGTLVYKKGIFDQLSKFEVIA